jgi:VWFA-related protein
MKKNWIPILVLLLVALPVKAGGQELDPEHVARLISDLVVVDFVVRDQRGRLVRDLRADEITVVENGEAQEIQSLHFVDAGRVVSGMGRPDDGPTVEDDERAAAISGAAAPVNLVSLIFDRLGNEARNLSRQAALDFVENLPPGDIYVAVFTADQRLYALQEFTRDKDRLREAILIATSRAGTAFQEVSEGIKRSLEDQHEIRRSAEAELGPGGQIQDPAVQARLQTLSLEYTLTAMMLGILRSVEFTQEGHQSQNALYSLLALVREQSRLAGRKSLLYFSEGWPLPQIGPDILRAVISEANRAHVSFYPVDARGLSTERQMERARETLHQSIEVSRQQVLNPMGGVTREQVFLSETGEGAIRQNYQGSLDNLAQSTGGFLIANTNNFIAGLSRMAEDLSGYYEVGYRPKDLAYDGSFRVLDVRVSRPGVSVQARRGYFALPPSADAPLRTFEIPVLVALNQTRPPAEIPFRLAVLKFDREGLRLRHTLVLEVPLDGIEFETDAKAGSYATRFSLMTVVKDPSGRIVRRFSRDYPIEGPLDRLEALTRGNMIFLEEFSLAAGRYVVEAAVYDHHAASAGAQRVVHVVESEDPRPGLSTLTLVRRVEEVGDGSRGPAGTLAYGNWRITPRLSGDLGDSGDTGVSVFVVVYPGEGDSRDLTLTLTLRRDGEVIARAEPDLPEQDDHGRIPFLATLLLPESRPGDYEIVAEAVQGEGSARRHAFFRIR